MEIVLNHVTRMTPDRICIAGIDPETWEFIRPVTGKDDLLTPDLLHANGGFIRPGAVIEIGDAADVGVPPEVEDRQTTVGALKFVRDLDENEYWKLIEQVATPTASEGFRYFLEEIRSRKVAIQEGRGYNSLAVIPVEDLRIWEKEDRIYFNFPIDGSLRASVKVTDTRFFEEDLDTPRVGIVEDISARIGSQVSGFLMLGVARAHEDPKSGLKLHWLMGNGICLEDRPLGESP